MCVVAVFVAHYNLQRVISNVAERNGNEFPNAYSVGSREKAIMLFLFSDSGVGGILSSSMYNSEEAEGNLLYIDINI